MMFGDCENHQHSTNASSNLFFIPIEARIKENVDFSLSKEPFLESREICQTQLRQDFPKGYNHQLLGRNALQGVSLGFFPQWIWCNNSRVACHRGAACTVTGKLIEGLDCQMNWGLPCIRNNIIFLRLTLSQVQQLSRAEMGLALYATPPDAIMHHMFVLACSVLIKTCHALLS